MSPCGRTDGQTNKQTSEYSATQSMDNVRLSFAICQKELGVQLHLQKNRPPSPGAHLNSAAQFLVSQIQGLPRPSLFLAHSSCSMQDSK